MRQRLAILLALITAVSALGCTRSSSTSDSPDAWAKSAFRKSDMASTVMFGEEMPPDQELRTSLESALDRAYRGPVMNEDEQNFSTRVFEAQSVTTPSAEATDTTLIVSGVLHETQWVRFGPFPAGTSDHRPTSVAFSGSPGSYRYLRGFELDRRVRKDYDESVERVDTAMARELTKEWRSDPLWAPGVFSGYDAHDHSPSILGLRELAANHFESMVERGSFGLECTVDSASPDGRYQIRRNADPGMEGGPDWWIADTKEDRDLCFGGQNYWYSRCSLLKPVWSKSTLTFDVPLSQGPSPSFVHCVIDLRQLRITHAIPVGPIAGQGNQ